ncbi:M15 family metallopeptidase [Candidatus Haliotispira prima]|uniref:M15 family metallopeptidase n=1 Tax=Candidatus Haliotispira prima TaxID=3034016 RepID=A0ABY8MG76_9SPIO|nr:M15 family metallopeptidase [Candidatus Haliotispira prima]
MNPIFSAIVFTTVWATTQTEILMVSPLAKIRAMNSHSATGTEATTDTTEAETDRALGDRLVKGKLPNELLFVPDFDFSEQSFQKFVQKYLGKVPLQKTLKQPHDFLKLLGAVIEQEDREPYLSLLVDKTHSLPQNYAPKDLVPLKNYPMLKLAGKELQLRAPVIPDLLKMNEAAKADGVSLSLGSAYRSFSYQFDVFRHYVGREGLHAANRYSAKPGKSQHQLGLALDFFPISQAFAGTAAGNWLLANALQYGFSLSYPEGREATTGYIYEPWHYRYVGPLIAKLIALYFQGSQQEFFSFWNQAAAELKQHYIPESKRS